MSEKLEEVFPTNSTIQDTNLRDNLDRTVFTIIMPIICAFGITGNCLNLIVLTRKHLKAATYIYLRAMAVADLMSLVFTIPMIVRYANDQLTSLYAAAWYHSHMELPLANAFIGSSVLVTVAITVERFIAVCIPLQAKKYQKPRVAKCVIIISFIVAFALYSPMSLYKYVSISNRTCDNIVCYTYNVDKNIVLTSWFIVYEWIREAMLRLGPTVLLALMNIKIIVVFYKKVKRRTKMQSKKDQKKFREDQRLIILLISIVILFFVCTLPASILILTYNSLDQKKYAFRLFRAIANIFEMTNYALNFYIYCLCSPEFRNTFLNTFCLCFKKSPRSERDMELVTSNTLRSKNPPPTNTEMNNTPSEKRNRSLLIWMTARQVAIIHDRISYPFTKNKESGSKIKNPVLENHVEDDTSKDVKSNKIEVSNNTESQNLSASKCKKNSSLKKSPKSEVHNVDIQNVNVYVSTRKKSDEKLKKKHTILTSNKDESLERPDYLKENCLVRCNSEKFENKAKPNKFSSLKRSPDSLRNEHIFINGIPKVRSKPEKLSNISMDSKRCFRSTSLSSSSSSSRSGSFGSRHKIRLDGISTTV